MKYDVSTPHRPGWGKPLSQTEIAVMFGVGRSTVHEAEQRAIQKLRRAALEDPQLVQLARYMGLLTEED